MSDSFGVQKVGIFLGLVWFIENLVNYIHLFTKKWSNYTVLYSFCDVKLQLSYICYFVKLSWFLQESKIEALQTKTGSLESKIDALEPRFKVLSWLNEMYALSSMNLKQYSLKLPLWILFLLQAMVNNKYHIKL